MTKREFDARTKENWLGPMRMASDERAHYRLRRMYADDVRLDIIARRRPGEYSHSGKQRAGLSRSYKRLGRPLLGL